MLVEVGDLAASSLLQTIHPSSTVHQYMVRCIEYVTSHDIDLSSQLYTLMPTSLVSQLAIVIMVIIQVPSSTHMVDATSHCDEIA